MTTTKTKLIELDPNNVTVDTNVRRDLGDLRGLTRSVAELGILEYLASTGYQLSDIELHVVNEANTDSGAYASDGPGEDEAA